MNIRSIYTIKIRKVVRAVLLVIMLAALIVQIGLLLLMRSGGDGMSFPVYLLEVSSDSMYPDYRSGDGILGIRSDYELLTAGEDITFYQDGSLITHRIIARNADGTYTTQGLMNPMPDAPVGEYEYVGKVLCKIPGLGWLILHTSGARNKTVVILAILLIFLGPDMAEMLSKRKRERN